MKPASFVGRQPIFDRARSAVAYELLFRSSDDNRAVFSDAERACAETVLAAMVDIGLDELIGGARGFVNVTEQLLLGPQLDGLPTDRITIELLETVRPTPEVVGRVRDLSKRGFQIALDDYLGSPELAPLVELADVVKVDVLALGVDEAERVGRRLTGKGAAVLAEKVEDAATFERLREAGYDLFQGYFFCRPTVLKARKVNANRVATLRLISMLQEPRLDLRKVEEAFRADVALSYRLFRFASSAFVARSRPVTSVRDAITTLGVTSVHSVVSLLALAGEDGKPDELVMTCVIRAKMCEIAAHARGLPAGCAFTAGLFSMLDSIMGVPMSELVQSLSLSRDIAAALLDRAGGIGAVVADVERYQEAMLHGGRWPEVDLSTTYVDALRWAHGTLRGLSS